MPKNFFTLDCTSAEWKEGHSAGLNNRSAKCPYEKGTHKHFNWVDGWLTGDAERSTEENGDFDD